MSVASSLLMAESSRNKSTNTRDAISYFVAPSKHKHVRTMFFLLTTENEAVAVVNYYKSILSGFSFYYLLTSFEMALRAEYKF